MAADEPPRWPTAMITGHRPQHLDPDSIDWIAGELNRIAWKLAGENGTGLLISGMALGADMLWANSAVTCKLPLRAHVPFPQQPDRWRDPELGRQWRRLVDYANRTGGVRTYGECPPGSPDWLASKLLNDRNIGMVEETVAGGGVVVAVLRESKIHGGTRNAWKAAREAGLTIIRVDPDRRTTTIVQAKAVVRHEQETLL